jgi:hypothetical protein
MSLPLPYPSKPPSSQVPPTAPSGVGASSGTIAVADGNGGWNVRNLLPADVGINLTTTILPADIGAAAQTDLLTHTTNTSNPHSTTAAQVGINSSMLTALTALAAGTYSGGSGGGGLASGLLYGDGSDGVVTFDGTTTFSFATLSGSTYTLTRDINLSGGSVINSGVTIEVACSRIFCIGLLTNNGTIQSNGITATGQPAVSYNLAGNLTSLGHPGNGGAGGNKVNGSAGGAGAGAGAGGIGGVTGANTPGASGASAAITLPHTSNVALGAVMAVGVWTPFGRGGGGGGGCGDSSNTGGAGGTGAGLVLITAQSFINNGVMQAIGGNGAPGTAGNASGGGGGGGGSIVVVSAASITGSGSVTCAGGTGGLKAAGGTGNNGAAGAAGPGLTNIVLPLDTVTGNPYTWAYGDGSDGVVTFDGTTTNAFSSLSGSTYTLTRDVFLASGSIINSGVTVVQGSYNSTLANPQAFRIFCKGTLTNNGTISNNGAPGSVTNSYLGSAVNQGTVSGPSRGGPGASGSGTPGFTGSGSFGGGAGGGGGKGSSAASQSNATGGSGGGSFGTTGSIPRSALATIGSCMEGGSWQMFGQGGSGGGGTADGTNVAGSGGQGGGLVLIAAVIFINNGVIQALGGNGGSPVTGTCGAGGGGGGGMILMITTAAVTGTGSTSTAGGTGGMGTNTAAGHGQITTNVASSTTDGNNAGTGAVLNLLVA